METTASLVHRFLEQSARRFPEKTAVVYEGRRTTFSTVNAQANRLAHGLIRAGIGPGDLVILVCENSIEYVFSYYGILKTGAVVVSLNTDIKPEAMAGLFRELEPKALIVSSRLQKTLRSMDPSALGTVTLLFLSSGRFTDGNVTSSPPLVALSGSPDKNPRSDIDPKSCAAIVYTSGSSGKPKGVMLSHANIVANTRAIVDSLELTADDIQMVVLPFFYVMGKSLLNTHIAAGGTVVINNRFAYTAAVLRQMAEEGVTGFSGVPSTYAHLLFRSPLAAYRNKLPALRYCSQAGGHMPAHIKRELLKVLPEHTRLVIMYGASEASARLTYLPPDRLTSKIDSIGVPISGVTMSVMSPEGRTLGPGETGELIARGENIMLGYFGDEEGTKKVVDKHGYHTGDLGYRDEDGYYFVTGRKDDQVKVGGRRIAPEEIEDKIIESGLAVECIVFGIPDPILGIRLAALVVPIEESADTVANILRYCAAKLPRFEVPQAVRLVDSIPRTGSGKPDRGRSVSIFLGSAATKS